MIRYWCSQLAVIMFSLCVFAEANAQTVSGSISAGVEGHYGFVFAHRPSMQPLQHSHLGAVVFTLSHQTNGSKQWHSLYHYPEIGLKYGFYGLGNKEQLGYGHAVYPYIDIPLGKSFNHPLHFQFGWGLGYITKPYTRLENYKNVAIGSHLNAVIAFNFHTEIRLTERDIVAPAIGLTHFSNGSTAMPNLGINLTTVQLHYRHSFGTKKEVVTPSLSDFKKHLRIATFGSWAFKQVYPLAGKTWYAYSLSANVLKQYSAKSAVGLGADFIYDPSISFRMKKEKMAINSSSDIRLGMAASYEVIVSDFSVILQMGLYAKSAWKQDGIYYNRLGMRYVFAKNIFATINLKTHLARADFIEWGIGYYFKR
ncbi:MAG: acyloxyacyl hydrolase [Bacteroidetes bacterium]|nr:acyloxyacyl hydrolase [Bacteroidota bacterium]